VSGRIVGSAVTTLLVVAAIALACWFVLSHLTGATLIVFRTGSMSPTMPQGALAVTLPISADELEIGDVVTLQRVGERVPVTHRIIGISEPQLRDPNAADIRAAAPDAHRSPDPADPRAREITMQGDDNEIADSLPYLATDAREVVFSVPAVGYVAMLLRTPIGMGSLILLVGLLTAWAFWPRSAGEAIGESSEAEVPGENPAVWKGGQGQQGEEASR